MHTCYVCNRDLPDTEFHKSRVARHNFICKECENRRQRGYHHNAQIKAQTEKANEVNFEHALGGYVIRILNHTKPFEHKFNIQSTSGESFTTDSKEQFLKKLNELI